MTHKSTVFLASMVLAGVGALAGGCTGDPGPIGPAGPAGSGTPGAPGAAGEAGAPGQTTVVVLSERAKVGIDISPVPIDLTGLTSDQAEKIGYGSYLVNAVADCNGCHVSSASKFLAGGQKFDLPGGEYVYARNITTGGPQITEAQFIEALQTGKDFGNSGTVLAVMPWPYYRWMTTSDLKAIYAYIQAVPAETNAVPADSKATAGAAPIVPLPSTYNEGDTDPNRVALPADGSADPGNVLRGLAIQPLATPPGFGNAAGPPNPSLEDQAYFGTGSYLVNAVGACSSCHTNPDRDYTPGSNYLKINTAQYLTGGKVFVVPSALQSSIKQVRNMSQNLTGATHGYYDPFAAFMGIIDQGIHTLDPMLEPVGFPMPWQAFRNMVTDDLIAIYTYFVNVPRITGAGDKATTSNAEWCASNADCTWAASDSSFAGETCNTTAHECVGQTCATNADCAHNCQTCSSTKCVAPAANSTCVANGI